MSELEARLAPLRAFKSGIHRDDPDLVEETPTTGLEAMKACEGSIESQAGLESIILKRTWPVLAIRRNDTQLIFIDPADSAICQAHLMKAKDMLGKATRRTSLTHFVASLRVYGKPFQDSAVARS